MAEPEKRKLGMQDVRMLWRLAHYLRPYRLTAVTGFGLVMVGAGLVIAGPLIIRHLIDDGLMPGKMALVAAFALAYLGIEFTKFFVEYFQAFLLQRLGQLSMRDLRTAVFRHLQKLPFNFYEDHRVGAIVTRTTNDIQSLAELFSVALITLFKDFVLIVGISVALVVIHPELGLVTLAAAPAVVVAVIVFRRYLRLAYRRVRAAVAQLNTTVQENITGVRTIQLFGVEGERHERFSGDNRELRDAMLESIRMHAIFSPFVAVSSALALALVFWYGGNEVMAGGLSVGMLVAYIQYVPTLITPIRDMGEKFTILQSAFAGAERIFGVLDTPVEIADRPGLEPLEQARGEVAFEGVSFEYRPGIEVLHDISFRIAPGERVALVGKTGSGKTTIARLIARFYDPQQGRVTLDGRDLRDVAQADLRRAVSVVTQDVFLFADSVFENVRLGDERLSRERVEEACRWTHAETFVRN
ncbi:MAG: ABC transporter ATP-binding protein, partial [Planctomycetota bacterium]